MDYSIVVLLFCFIVTVTDGLQYYISTHSTKRHDVNCTLAVPKLDYSSDLISINMGTVVNLTGNGVSRLWLGYGYVYRTFQYKGCLPAGELHPTATLKMYPDLGHCYSACYGSKYFGLKTYGSNASCYCFSEDPKSTSRVEPSCTCECSKPANTSCGGPEFISLYQKVNLPEFKSTASDTFCLWIHPKPVPFEYKWGDCEVNHTRPTLCQKAPGHVDFISLDSVTWHIAAIQCFNNEIYPMGYHGELDIHITEPTWTGVTRSKCAVRVNGIIEGDAIFYDTTDGSLKLDLKHSIDAHALCARDSPHTTVITTEQHTSEATTPTSSVTTINITDDVLLSTMKPASDVSSSQEDILATSAVDNGPHISTMDSIAHQASEVGQTHNWVPVYAGVPIAVLVVISVAVAVIIFRRRSRGKPSNGNTRPAQSYDHTDSAKNIDINTTIELDNVPQNEFLNSTSLTHYEDITDDSIDGKTTAGQHTDTDMYNYISNENLNSSNKDEGDYGPNVYHLLEKTKIDRSDQDTYTSPKKKDDVNKYGQVSHDMYDISGNVPHQHGPSENMYNTANYTAKATSDDMYNHVGGNDWKEDDAYDTTRMTGETKLRRNQLETDRDSTYNHTDGNPRATQDDTYNVANYTDTGEADDSNLYNVAVFPK